MLGVFDSGVGGLTIVREIRRALPGADLAYVADTAHVPYGGRSDAQIQGFALGIGRFLIERCGARTLVVACNTATAAAAEALRARVTVPVVATEPGVKPATRVTRTGVIGVLATEGTVRSERLGHLIRRFAEGVEVISQPCPGLAEAVEAGAFDTPETEALVRRYVEPLRERGADTLVLGCTHYPLLHNVIARVAGPGVALVETGEAVARRVAEVAAPTERGRRLEIYATGDPAACARAAAALLGEPVAVRPLIWNYGELIEHAKS